MLVSVAVSEELKQYTQTDRIALYILDFLSIGLHIFTKMQGRIQRGGGRWDRTPPAE